VLDGTLSIVKRGLVGIGIEPSTLKQWVSRRSNPYDGEPKMVILNGEIEYFSDDPSVANVKTDSFAPLLALPLQSAERPRSTVLQNAYNLRAEGYSLHTIALPECGVYCAWVKAFPDENITEIRCESIGANSSTAKQHASTSLQTLLNAVAGNGLDSNDYRVHCGAQDVATLKTLQEMGFTAANV